MSSLKQRRRALAYAIEPAIYAVDVESLRILIGLGAKIDVKIDYIGKLVEQCSLDRHRKKISKSDHPLGRKEDMIISVDHKKYIKMMEFLISTGCKLPVLKMRLIEIGDKNYELERVVEFLFNQGVDANLGLLGSYLITTSINAVYIRTFQLVYHFATLMIKDEITKHIENVSRDMHMLNYCRLLCSTDYQINAKDLKSYFDRMYEYNHPRKAVEFTFVADMMIEAFF